MLPVLGEYWVVATHSVDDDSKVEEVQTIPEVGEDVHPGRRTAWMSQLAMGGLNLPRTPHWIQSLIRPYGGQDPHPVVEVAEEDASANPRAPPPTMVVIVEVHASHLCHSFLLQRAISSQLGCVGR